MQGEGQEGSSGVFYLTMLSLSKTILPGWPTSEKGCTECLFYRVSEQENLHHWWNKNWHQLYRRTWRKFSPSINSPSQITLNLAWIRTPIFAVSKGHSVPIEQSGIRKS
jgi:hypothetical protein